MVHSNVWSLFVLYPNKEPVCRDLPQPQNLAELREGLQVFDDQHLLIADRVSVGTTTSSGGTYPGGAGFTYVEQVEQLYDGALLRVTVPRRCIYVSLEGSDVLNKPVAWYPGAGAEQIENAIVKACRLPLGTPVELMDGDGAIVISATIPNESILRVVPIADVAVGNNSSRHLSPIGKRRENGEREGRSSYTPTVPRSASAVRGSPANRPPPPGQDRARARSVTPANTGTQTMRVPEGVNTGGSQGGRGSMSNNRDRSPTRDNQIAADLTVPSGKVSAPDEHCVHILAGHAGFVLCLCTVGDVLFTGSQDCNIMIWDLNNLQYIGTLPGHRGFVKCLVATLARKILCSGSQDRTIKIWSLESFAATKTLVGHTSDVNALMILEGNDVLVSGGEDKSIRVWDLSSMVMLASLDQAHLSGVFALAQLDEGQLISASRDRTMKVWLANTWQSRRTLSPPHYDGVSDLAVGLRSGKFYSASRDRSLRRWDSNSFESDLQLTHAHGDWLTSVALSPSEEVVFSGSKDCVVKVWDSSLHCKDLLLGHRGPISALLNVDNHLFSASHDRTVRVWRVDHFED